MKKSLSRKKLLLLASILLLVAAALWAPKEYVDARRVATYMLQIKPVPELASHEHDPSLDSVTDNEHHKIVESDSFIVPYDAWVKGFNLEVPGVESPIIHHLYVARLDLKDSLCANYPWQALFVTSDVNSGPQIFSDPYGIFLPKGTPLKVFAMLHNPAPPLGPGKTYTNVKLEVSMYLSKNSILTKHIPLEYHRLHLSDIPCQDPVKAEVFTVPGGAQHFVAKNSATKGGVPTSSYTFPTSGTVVSMGGHFHPFEGGKDVAARLKGRLVQDFTARQLDHGSWKSWYIPIYPYFTPVKAGDTISITSEYDNPYATPIRGAMGMLVFYFARK